MNYYLEMNLEQLQKEHAELLAFNENLDRERNKYRDDARKYAKKVQMIASLFFVPCDDPELTLKAIKTIVEQVRGGDQNLKNTAQTIENTAFEGGDQKSSFYSVGDFSVYTPLLLRGVNDKHFGG
ncbi:hypothetical protein [Acinetobacter radioresistens]|uniref:hypothetical protein n=1 Tax=Acinetobacter radioresistens TaxID=40216 RepID=UPI002091047B|nr:hypothetical protein [Acinetobacter radioresistens]